MKNIIATFLGLSVVLFLSTYFIQVSDDTQKVSTNLVNPKIIQIGAFEEKDSADYMVNNIGGKIVKDDVFYYVYIGILSDTANIERIISYMNKNNIYYYIKDGNFNTSFLEELNKYEEMMKTTTSDIAFLELNKKVIDIYMEKNI